MPAPLLPALRQARAALDRVDTVEAGEAVVARRLSRELDEAIARLEGKPVDKDLIAIICHDLKDPLASIVMGAGFLKKTISTEEAPARRVVEAIARSADRMSRIVTDFHDLAKLEAGTLPLEVRPCDVGAVLQSMTSALEGEARDKQLALTVDVPSSSAGPAFVALCDRARLIDVVGKLVGNAIKFTAAGGSVAITLARADGGVRVSVRDTGKGIPSDRLADIFDRAANARRTPRDGPGLGLAIVRGLVERQGGRVEVKSRPGEGSEFSFTLPAAAV
jgi:signal transduction histidine kinase